MFDIGWTELLLIGIVALIVIGPQDLPDMFRQLGRFTGKLRSMSRDFQRAIDQAARESGVKDLAKDMNDLTSPKSLGLNAVREAADRFEKWDPLKPVTAAAQKPLTPAAMPASPAAEAAKPTPEELADAEPEPVLGPETKALYQKKAQVRAERKTARATADAPASPAAAAAEPGRPRRRTAKAAAVAPEAAAAEAADRTPRAPRRRKADPA
ncbi:MAG: Sec-independent protein translocase protein TatB [Pseudomonadota bacterium]|jgi:sec-independent protein translocase protein TatB